MMVCDHEYGNENDDGGVTTSKPKIKNRLPNRNKSKSPDEPKNLKKNK
jgi:hypothetical protein